MIKLVNNANNKISLNVTTIMSLSGFFARLSLNGKTYTVEDLTKENISITIPKADVAEIAARGKGIEGFLRSYDADGTKRLEMRIWFRVVDTAREANGFQTLYLQFTDTGSHEGSGSGGTITIKTTASDVTYDNAEYPTVKDALDKLIADDETSRGGWREVATSADLESIPEDSREEGMGVFVVAEQSLYVYIGGKFVKTLVNGRNGHTLILPFLSDASFKDGDEKETTEIESRAMFGCTLDELSEMVQNGVSLDASFVTKDADSGISNVYGGRIAEATFTNLDELTLSFDSNDPLNGDANTRYTVKFTWKGVGDEVEGRDASLPTKYSKASVSVVKVANSVGGDVTALEERIAALEAIVSKFGTEDNAQSIVEAVDAMQSYITVNPTTKNVQEIKIEDQYSKQYTLKVNANGAASTLVLVSAD